MMKDDLRRLALALPRVEEKSHFDKADFRVKNKIFVSLKDDATGVVKLTLEDQRVMVDAEPKIFQPIPGAWGRKGWTKIVLANADEVTLKSALQTAWQTVNEASRK
jgi:hypothetical protein